MGCIVDGAMRFNYLGENVVAPRGQVNLVVPGEPHDGHGADEAGWAYRMFYLPPGALVDRITSYNVCYTKLLRLVEMAGKILGDEPRGKHVHPAEKRQGGHGGGFLADGTRHGPIMT